jgi:ribosomal RNA assembly protein
MPPSKLDLQLASGEYFLKPQEKEAIEKKKVEDRQAARAAEKRATREEAFVAPVEERVEGVKERRKRKRDREA